MATKRPRYKCSGEAYTLFSLLLQIHLPIYIYIYTHTHTQTYKDNQLKHVPHSTILEAGLSCRILLFSTTWLPSHAVYIAVPTHTHTVAILLYICIYVCVCIYHKKRKGGDEGTGHDNASCVLRVAMSLFLFLHEKKQRKERTLSAHRLVCRCNAPLFSLSLLFFVFTTGRTSKRGSAAGKGEGTGVGGQVEEERDKMRMRDKGREKAIHLVYTNSRKPKKK